MVGKRELWRAASTSKQRHMSSGENESVRPQSSQDLESGIHAFANGNGDVNGNGDAKPRPQIWRFKDAANTALEDKRREDLKKALLAGIDREGLEKFRKSDKELKEIKNKKVRQFYQEQNARLNDWLEVDSIVMAVADDVLESMDPDPDHDGHRERGGGLQAMEGNIYEFLPDDEKETRRKANQRAKWAINVNVIALSLIHI